MPEQLTTTEIEDLFSATNETRYAAAQRLGIRNADRLTVEDYLIKVSDLLRQAGDSNALSRLQNPPRQCGSPCPRGGRRSDSRHRAGPGPADPRDAIG